MRDRFFRLLLILILCLALPTAFAEDVPANEIPIIGIAAPSSDEMSSPTEIVIPAPEALAQADPPAEQETILLVAGSDFQDPATAYSTSGLGKNGDYSGQVSRIKTIMTNIRSACGDAYCFISGGDHCYDMTNTNATKTQTGVNNVKNAVRDVFGDDIKTLFLQGNHDAPGAGVEASGPHDTDHFGVFFICAKDYRFYPLNRSMWSDYKQSGDIVKNLASQLDAYLAEKFDTGYDKPIFICTHVPLHFSTRTVTCADGTHAQPLYEAIAKYADDLNIIFLYGHDHSGGDDDYLGGSAQFLQRGDTIRIAKFGSQSEYTSHTLNFTYMNYGYTGYYWTKSASTPSKIVYSNADNTLTMTSFEITGNTVVVRRWDEKGPHILKAEGAASQGYRGSAEVCPVTDFTYASPQTVYPPDPLEIIFSGTLNGGVAWAMNRGGTLFISGTGAMPEFAEAAPWLAHGGRLRSVQIGEGVTSIASGAFEGCAGLTEVSLPLSLNRVGANAFSGCTGLQTVRYAGSELLKKAIEIVPDGNAALTALDWICESVDPFAGLADEILVLPTSVVEVGEEAFLGIDADVVILPASCARVESCAFADCEHLKYVIVESANTVIAADAFEGSDPIIIYQ